MFRRRRRSDLEEEDDERLDVLPRDPPDPADPAECCRHAVRCKKLCELSDRGSVGMDRLGGLSLGLEVPFETRDKEIEV